MTQLQLIEGAAPPRPRNHSDSIIGSVAQSLLHDVIEWLGSDFDGDQQSVLRDLTKALGDEWEWDGYQLTKALRDWDCDRDMVDIMDGAEGYAYEAHDKEVRRWVSEYDVRPKFEAGATVRITHTHKSYNGEITAVDLQRAIYTVFVEALGHIRGNSGQTGTLGLCIPFERVEEVAQV